MSGRESTPDERLRRVVIAVDFHDPSREAARWTMRHLAPGAACELVHVLDLPELPGPLRGLDGEREQRHAAAREEARRRLAEFASLGDGPRAGTHVREGKPAAAIVALAEEVGADLIVVGERGPRRGVGALLGSTAERVLFDARIPVLLARKVEDMPPRRLLAAVDDAPVAREVLAWTRSLLARPDATATVLNVVDRLLLMDELTGLPSAESLRRLEEDARAAMQSWLDEMVGEAGLPESRVERKVGVGDPSYEIIAEAASGEADLLLLGTKGGDVARTPLIGRIINKVVRSSPCSVLVVGGRVAAGPA